MLAQMMQFSVPLPFFEGWKVAPNSGHRPLTSQSLPTWPDYTTALFSQFSRIQSNVAILKIPMTIRDSKLKLKASDF